MNLNRTSPNQTNIMGPCCCLYMYLARLPSSNLNPANIVPIDAPFPHSRPHPLNCDRVLQVLVDWAVHVEPSLPLHARQHIHRVWEGCCAIWANLEVKLGAEKRVRRGRRSQGELQTDLRVGDK